MIDDLLAEMASLDGVDSVSIVDSSGFASRGHPLSPETEQLAANVRSIIELSLSDEQGSATLIGERGYILAFHISADNYLAIQANSNAILGSIRSNGIEMASRIATLM